MNKIRRILVVVDDAAGSQKIRPAFEALPPQWNVYFSQSIEDAISYLGQVSFDVVIADLKGGPLACTQFLQEVWARYPSVMRFVVSPRMSKELMVACAIGSHQFIEKPVTHEAVAAELERVDLVNALLHDEKIRDVIARVRTFPPRPKIYNAVMNELNSPTASAQSVGELVSRDMAISTKLIQVVNSAAFGLVQQVSTPVEAVFLLGLETTASLVLGIEAFAQLDGMEAPGPADEQVWRHSQLVARSAKQIAEWMTGDSKIAHHAFTAGLLHDVGKVALSINLKKEYQGATRVAREQKRRIFEVEEELFGANHAEVGGYLLGLWGLPGPIIEAVAAHHLPPQMLRSRFSALTAVHLADALEFAKHSLTTGFAEFRLSLDYPPDLKIEDQLEAFAELLSLPELANTEHFVKRKAAVRHAAGIGATESPIDLAMRHWWARLLPARSHSA